MAKTKESSAKDRKKDLRKQVAETLVATFTDIKANVGEKKFNKKVKKASKLLASGAVAKPVKSDAAPAKAAVKKAGPQKTAPTKTAAKKA